MSRNRDDYSGTGLRADTNNPRALKFEWSTSPTTSVKGIATSWRSGNDNESCKSEYNAFNILLSTITKTQPPIIIPTDSIEPRDLISYSPFPRNQSPPTDIIPGREI